MKLSEIVNVKTALEKIVASESSLPIKVAYRLSKLLKKVSKPLKSMLFQGLFLEKQMNHIVYRITNNITKEFYIGYKDLTLNPPFPEYWGSSKILFENIFEYGSRNFKNV